MHSIDLGLRMKWYENWTQKCKPRGAARLAEPVLMPVLHSLIPKLD